MMSSFRGQQGITGTATYIPVSHSEQHFAFEDMEDFVLTVVDVERW
jgi:hypothetical protein